MKTWEYETSLVHAGDSVVTELNEMGKKGWEAFDIYRNLGHESIITYKREISEKVENPFEALPKHNHNPSLTKCGIHCPSWGTENETGMVEV